MRARTKFEDDDDRRAYEEELLASPLADAFALALDHAGWMIVGSPAPTPRTAAGPYTRHPPIAPSWAEPDPTLEVIEGGRKDEPIPKPTDR